jgi:hypothetical protein
MTTQRKSSNGVSFEIGASFIPMDGGLPGLTDAEKQVFACLNAYRWDIVNAERDFRVTRLAIAGAIAWEMLQNVRTWSPRSVGFGKVHLYNYSKTGAAFGFMAGAAVGSVPGGVVGAAIGAVDFDTAAKQAEDAGYLPVQTRDARKVLLSTPSGAIKYIAGIMTGVADIAARDGFRDVRNDPEILTNVYQSMDLNTWDKHLKEKPKGSDLKGGNAMDIWVMANLDFLTAAVGKSDIP